MTYVAIMSVVENRVAKYAEFDTKAAASAHVSAHADRWPDAFVVKAPSEHVLEWWVEGQTVTVVVPEPPRRMVRKSLVQQRLIDADKMDDAYALLTTMPSAFARWFAPDRPEVYADDPDALALLAAIGADPEVIMAAE